MADHGTVEYSTASGNDYETHEQTYKLFLKLLKGNIITIVILLILMAYFLV
jgi:aa3 type cytochrome c oxidase subunit IV